MLQHEGSNYLARSLKAAREFSRDQRQELAYWQDKRVILITVTAVAV